MNVKDMELKEILNLDEDEFTDGEIVDFVFDWEKENSEKMLGVKLIIASFRDALNHIEKAFDLKGEKDEEGVQLSGTHDTQEE